MEGVLKKILIIVVVAFLFFAGIISRYSELIWIYHSYLFALLILLIFVMFTLWMFKSNEIHILIASPLVYIMIVVFLLLITTSIYRYDSVVSTYKVITPILLFIVVVNLVKSKKDFLVSVYILVTFGLVIGVMSYVQFYNLLIFRLPSIWGYANTFAAFLVLETMLGFGVFYEEKRPLVKLLLYIVPVFFIYLIFLTVSRGGYIAFAVTLLTAFLVSREKVKFLKQWGLVFIGAALLIAVAAPREIILENFFRNKLLVKFAVGTTQNQSLYDRIHLAFLSLRIFSKRPITGFGLGSFRYTFTKFETIPEHFRIDPHSLFFKFLAETGIAGTVTFFGFITYVLLKSLKYIMSFRNDVIYAMLFSGFVGLLCHMCIDVDTYPIMFIVLFTVLALLIPGEFVSNKRKHKFFLTSISAVIILLVVFSLFPKTVAARFAVKGAHSSEFRSYFQEAIKLDAESAVYRYYYGSALMEYLNSADDLISIKSALSEYEAAERLNKNDFRYPFESGRITIFLHDSSALASLERARNLYPSNGRICLWSSVAYAVLTNDTNRAGYFLDRAKSLGINDSDKNLDYLFAKSIYLLKRGKIYEAKETFKKMSFLANLYDTLGTQDRNFSHGIFLLEEKLFSDLIHES